MIYKEVAPYEMEIKVKKISGQNSFHTLNVFKEIELKLLEFFALIKEKNQENNQNTEIYFKFYILD